MAWLLLCLHLLFFHFPSFTSSFNFLCHHDESSALLQFKSTFTIRTDYYFCDELRLLKTTTWKNGSDCCSWHGVTCNNISGYVIGLNLGCEGIEGDIDSNSTLFNLSHLQALNLSFNDFSFNDFSNTHFPSKFGEFSSLKHLDLSNSDLYGEIPTKISHLSKLESLRLSGNGLVWEETTLKRLVQNATNLREMFLDETDMSSINLNFMDLIFNQSSSLVTLSLPRTGLSGIRKKNILCLPSVQELDMSMNELEGQLPDLGCSTSLRILDLSDCDFKGPIPSSFSNFTNLTSLSLSDNYLSGSIPSSLFKLQHLIHLYLSYNSFSGQIPSSLFNLTQLVTLDCSYNKLKGPLPKTITGFQKLVVLTLNDNLLNGTIPSALLSLPSLVNFDITNNQLTGYIGAISSYSLEELSLCGNKLQGNIPESIFNLENLTTLCLSSNNFSGVVNFQNFSKLQNLYSLSLSHNRQLSLTFESNVNYNFSQLRQLYLSSVNLTEFPKLSEKLPSLDSLDLSNNKLNGRVPTWLIETSRSLNLSQNCFTSIDQISRNIDQLFGLDLSFNLLEGDITLSICNMSSLQLLNLAHNKLTGIIPQCLANISSLQVLDLQMNRFYGSLPSNFSKSCELETLNLNGNQLEGYFPKSLSHCKNLQVLNLRDNKLVDKFPDCLQPLQYLKVLVLQDNKLHGPIANLKIKHPFPSLIIFDISGNNFSGPLPKAYLKCFEAMKKVSQVKDDGSLSYMETSLGYYSAKGNASYYDSVSVTTKGIKMTLVKIPTMFVSIDLSRNKFEGEIIDVIGELDALKGLNLSHNRLTGHIPQSIGKLTNLESLDLSSNMLTGVVPAELTNLISLEVINFSNNRLVGEIPQGQQFDTFSNDSYEGNLGLCGFPLSKKCGPEEPSPPSANKFWSKEKFGFGWKPVAIGYGCGFVIGIGIGYFVLLIGKPRWLVMMFGGQPKQRGNRRRTRVRRTNGSSMNQMVPMS
ncbi:unnamed protein product [Trifolium pratense]|uniref:Uncharacterized protein n=1 Tax=Trifolium pratense TaxID=57577 RepID=A0ACB0IPF5_TRIPR|nr:unnamed protein product [Trifolium pratense]